MSEMEGNAIERVARALCEHDGYDADELEPGNVIIHPLDDLESWTAPDGTSIDRLADDGTRPPDGLTRSGEKCHFLWRDYIAQAQVAVRATLTPTQ